MKTVYHIPMPKGIRPAIGDVSEIGTGVYLINRINVPEPFRGQGYGHRILQCILNDADREHVTLVLEVHASDSRDIMTNDTLIAWYRRHGFKMVSWVNKLMERRNNGHTPTFEEAFRH
jgi:GNAT superfamily N-acetyltransferase